MVTIELVDLLTASLSFLGGAVGGFVVVFLETRARHSEERRRTVEELSALLLLLSGEISSNKTRLSDFKKVFEDLREFHVASDEADEPTVEEILKRSPSFASTFNIVGGTAVSTATWDSSRVRIARLLDAETIKPLLNYYPS